MRHDWCSLVGKFRTYMLIGNPSASDVPEQLEKGIIMIINFSY
jgi:hypothetical protein